MIQRQEKKFSLGMYITIVSIVMALIVVCFTMYKYSIEGESRPPFVISKVIITSGAKTVDIHKKEAGYVANVFQTNDIKIAIQKNPKYKKEAKMKRVTINNIQITETNRASEIALYRPSKGTNLFEYQEPYLINGTMEYLGGPETDIKSDVLTISNQGGILEFSVAQHKLGEIEYKENEQIAIDGTLLNRLGLKQEDVAFKLTFDLIIELDSNVKYKCVVTMDLPKGNIAEDGIEIYEQSNFKSVFKRI